MFIIKSFTLLIFILLCTSCGQNKPKLVKVTGKISFKNKPLTAGSIYFHPASTNSFTKDNPSSLLQEDGSFNMKTYPYGEGVSPGEYKITLAPQLAARISLPQLSDPDKTNTFITVPDAGIENFVLDVGNIRTR